MDQIIKHSFEAVSLLTTDKGMLAVTMIPAMGQPAWVIPSSLILNIEEEQERVWTYLWQRQEIAVFHLLPQKQDVDKIIILEGNTINHRIALQTAGELRQAKLRISEVKDIELPKKYQHQPVLTAEYNKHQAKKSSKAQSKDDSDNKSTQQPLNENEVSSYLYQMVLIDNVEYLIPDLDKIAHHLIDLNGSR
ncbi:hypothetical protein [Psychrobacter sp. M13]|uniref:hypothetical protein n=1 Tax=Psychrobacter sp. M13 TaxID=3067275 RepID=UPI00273A881A|nr:hypothetical protein [Psychrobacter sp. M13]WLP94103.1 hypothetical protein Q9G97_11020 [Psychrobacter sp. M13]